MSKSTIKRSYYPWAESLVQSQYRSKPTTTAAPLVTRVNVVYKPLRRLVQTPTEEELITMLVPYWYILESQ